MKVTTNPLCMSSTYVLDPYRTHATTTTQVNIPLDGHLYRLPAAICYQEVVRIPAMEPLGSRAEVRDTGLTAIRVPICSVATAQAMFPWHETLQQVA